LSNPRDLLLRELGTLLWTERMLAFEVLPKLRDAVSDDELRAAVEEHLLETRGHVDRVEQAFESLGSHPSSIYSPTVSALAGEHDELAGKVVEDRLRDVWHAHAAARTEHLELAMYESVLALVRALDADGLSSGLEENREQERQALAKVEQIAARVRQELS
jgi:ferritin-like metal-binding protein YciE